MNPKETEPNTAAPEKDGILADWVNSRKTPRGIGIDCVCISQMRDMDRRMSGVFARRTFTPRELELAEASLDYWEFLAGRFAVKEAVFKALSCSEPNPFDFRKVETLRRDDGCPVINLDSIPKAALETAGGTGLLVSITGEGDYAIALVQLI